MTISWASEDIVAELSHLFSPSLLHAAKQLDIGDPISPSSTTSPDIGINVLITFDNKGISSHANHISLYYGALQRLKQADPSGSTVSMYSLTTTNIFRKYTSVLDIPYTIIITLLRNICGNKPATSLPNHLLFFSNVYNYHTTQRAMTEGHKSQMLWFRYGWLGLSRYVSINDLVRVHP
jgi:N-acetylglucosaminylphosphatidylinositol deacetylase